MTAPGPRLQRRIRDVFAFYHRWVSSPIHGISRAINPAGSGVTSACRFQPTCSEYAATALATHGLVRGTLLAALRVLRCHPFARGGFDPVPPAGPAFHGTDERRHLP